MDRSCYYWNRAVFSAIFLIPAFCIANESINAYFVLTFFSGCFASFNFPIVVDMTLHVISPSVRSTASGIQKFVAEGFGDALSPSLIGLITDELNKQYKAQYIGSDAELNYLALRNAMWIIIASAFISSVAFFCTATFVEKDRKKVYASNLRNNEFIEKHTSSGSNLSVRLNDYDPCNRKSTYDVVLHNNAIISTY